MSEVKESHHKATATRVVKTGKPIYQPPDYLGQVGKICYQQIVADLEMMEVADRADSKAVEAFAAAYEEYRKARKECLDNGFTYETTVGEDEVRIIKRPEVEIMNAAWTRMRSLLPELYMTPASRQKVPGAGKDAVPNAWDDLIPGA
jgi:P27 family predicted phage terminase small subunit